MASLHAHARRTLGVPAILIASLIALAALSTGPSVAANAAPTSVSCSPGSVPSGGGVDMSATILGPEGSPCDSTSTGGGSTVGGSSSGGAASTSTRPTGSGAASTPTSVDTDAEPTPPVAADEVDLGGVLNIGGLSSSYVPSLNPFGGEVELSFSVRNVSKSTIEASADFWMEGPFGNRISAVDGVSVAGLKPGESRTVSASLSGVGQWAVLSAHARFTPPDVVDETELSPLTRDATVFALPWLVVLLVALSLAAWVFMQVLRRREVVEPIGALA